MERWRSKNRAIRRRYVSWTVEIEPLCLAWEIAHSFVLLDIVPHKSFTTCRGMCLSRRPCIINTGCRILRAATSTLINRQCLRRLITNRVQALVVRSERSGTQSIIRQMRAYIFAKRRK